MRRIFKKIYKKTKHAKHQHHGVDDAANTDANNDSSSEVDIAKLKQTLLNECEAPENLQCSILQEMPRDPVVTPYGHLFSRAAINNWIATHHTCPLTRQPLQQSDLMEHKNLATMIEVVTHQFHDLEQAINNMSANDEENIRQRIEVFNSFITLTNQDAAAELESVREQTLIMAIKNHLKLDINNHHHLEYWQQHSHVKFDLCAHVHDTVFPESYRIPKLIHDLMIIADQDYSTKSDFKAALDARRKHNQGPANFFDKPLVSIAALFRPPAGSEICRVDDVEKLRLG